MCTSGQMGDRDQKMHSEKFSLGTSEVSPCTPVVAEDYLEVQTRLRGSLITSSAPVGYGDLASSLVLLNLLLLICKMV